MFKSIRSSMCILAICATVLSVVSGSLCSFLMKKVEEKSLAQLEKSSEAGMATLTIESHFNLVSRIARNIMLGSKLESDLARYQKSLGVIRKNFAVLQELSTTDEDRTMVRQAEKTVLRYVDVAYKLCMEMRDVPRDKRYLHYGYFSEHATPAAEEARADFTKIVTRQENRYADIKQETAEQSRQAFYAILLLSLGVGLCAALMSLIVTRNITRALGEATDYARRVADGKSADIMPEKYGTEIRTLTSSIRSMVSQLESKTYGLLDSLPMPAALFDEQGRSLWWNTALAELTGGLRPDGEKHPVAAVLPDAVSPSLYKKALDTRQETRAEARFAGERCGDVIASPFRDERRTLLGILVTIFETTALQQKDALEKKNVVLAQLAENAS